MMFFQRRARVPRKPLIAAFTLFFLLNGAVTAENAPLDLSACYERALERNERVGIASAEWRAAEERYRQATDTLLPSLSFVGSAAFQEDRRTGGSDASGRNPEAYAMGIRAEQALYRGFRTTRVAEAREAEGRAARFDERRALELLYLDVADAYHQVLAYDRDRSLLEQLQAVLRETVDVVQDRVKRGRSRRADLISAQTELAETRVEIVAVDGLATAARELLSFLIDLPAEEVRLKDYSEPPLPPQLNEHLASAEERADIQAEEARAEAALRAVGAARGARQPEVLAAGEWRLWEDPDEDRTWNVTVAMAIPLFDDGVIRSHVREQQERMRISELNLAALRRSAQTDVRTAFSAYASAVAQLERLKEARTLARENYDIQKQDYELGRASQLDALSALAQWQRIERREASAAIAAHVSLVRLHVAAGRVTP